MRGAFQQEERSSKRQKLVSLPSDTPFRSSADNQGLEPATGSPTLERNESNMTVLAKLPHDMSQGSSETEDGAGKVRIVLPRASLPWEAFEARDCVQFATDIQQVLPPDACAKQVLTTFRGMQSALKELASSPANNFEMWFTPSEGHEQSNLHQAAS